MFLTAWQSTLLPSSIISFLTNTKKHKSERTLGHGNNLYILQFIRHQILPKVEYASPNSHNYSDLPRLLLELALISVMSCPLGRQGSSEFRIPDVKNMYTQL